MDKEDEAAVEYIATLALVTFGRQKNLVDGSLEPYTVEEAVATVQAVRKAVHAKHYAGSGGSSPTTTSHSWRPLNEDDHGT